MADPNVPDIAALEAAQQAAQTDLDAAKASCAAACDTPNEVLANLDPAARLAAVATQHVTASIDAGVDPTAAAIGGGRAIDPAHLALVAKGAQVSREGGDVAAALGADPAHVEAVQAAVDAHADHAESLGEKYRVFAEAGRLLAEGRERLDIIARATAAGLRIGPPQESQ